MGVYKEKEYIGIKNYKRKTDFKMEG